jgi:hypothetical protein
MHANQTPAAIAQLYTDRLIEMMAEPGISPKALENAEALARLWLHVSLIPGS